jgi:hypothetical protein
MAPIIDTAIRSILFGVMVSPDRQQPGMMATTVIRAIVSPCR